MEKKCPDTKFHLSGFPPSRDYMINVFIQNLTGESGYFDKFPGERMVRWAGWPRYLTTGLEMIKMLRFIQEAGMDELKGQIVKKTNFRHPEMDRIYKINIC